MSQNNQNRFAALSPSSTNQPKRNSKKNKKTSHEEGDEPLLNSKCPGVAAESYRRFWCGIVLKEAPRGSTFRTPS